MCIELAGPLWRTLRKTLTMIFSVMSYNENQVLHPLLPERNDHGYELRRRRHERGLFLRPTMPNAILYTDSYINIGLFYFTRLLFHQPTFYCLIVICQFIIPGKRISLCYTV